MRNYPTELLRSFIAVQDHGGFSLAAVAVGRSQPALSLQIKRLETLVGNELIRRTSREVQLTETGEVVATYARRILGLNDELTFRLEESQLSGTVRLGIPNEFAMSYLPQILGGFSKRYPDVKLEVVSQLSSELLDQQRGENLDIVIAINKDQVYDRKPVWSDDLVWVTGNEIPENRKSGVVALVVAPEGCVYRSKMLERLKEEKIPWRIAYTGTSYGGIRAAVMAGLGVTAVARSTVANELQVVKHSLLLPKLSKVDVHLHYLSRQPADLVVRLAEFIQQSFVSAPIKGT
ncbi:MAG: DNA-binding transcriptional LysR family regulator [Saprospiraceae bacterium]|jgi:DNA-binding transcriptional LysR family regulator